METEAATALGADLGATLIKLALRTPSGRTEFRLLPANAIERVAREVESIQAASIQAASVQAASVQATSIQAGSAPSASVQSASLRPARIGLTGGGTPEVASLLKMDTERVNEFAAWAAGSEELLQKQGVPTAPPYLLVSVGTGTSAIRVGDGKSTRIGGTALGGGTIVGLGAGLLGIADFGRLAALARAGDRRNVDLLVSDIYRGDAAPPLPPDLNASSFAKLARGGGPPRPEDLAHAVMGLVGENVGIICGNLALASGAERIVFAGGALRQNPALTDVLLAVASLSGRTALLLADGEFAGALGALRLACEAEGVAGG